MSADFERMIKLAEALQADEEIAEHVLIAKGDTLSGLVKKHASTIAAAPDLLLAARQAATRIASVLKDPGLNPNHRVLLDLAIVGLHVAIKEVDES